MWMTREGGPVMQERGERIEKSQEKMKRDRTQRTREKNSTRAELKPQNMAGIHTSTTFPGQALYTLQ